MSWRKTKDRKAIKNNQLRDNGYPCVVLMSDRCHSLTHLVGLDFFLPMKWKNLAPGANSRLFLHAQAHKFSLLHNNQMGRSRFSSLPWNNVFFLLKRNSKVTLRRQHKRWRRKFFYGEFLLLTVRNFIGNFSRFALSQVLLS